MFAPIDSLEIEGTGLEEEDVGLGVGLATGEEKSSGSYNVSVSGSKQLLGDIGSKFVDLIGEFEGVYVVPEFGWETK